MNNRTNKREWISTSSIIHVSLTIILLGLLVTWGIELLIKELFRLG